MILPQNLSIKKFTYIIKFEVKKILHCSSLECSLLTLDGVGPVDNRPSTN